MQAVGERGPDTSASGREGVIAWLAVPVGAAAGVLTLLRVSGWKAAVGFDAWAYVTWGEAVVRGSEPAYYKGGTTPKPLATAMMAALSWLDGRESALVAVAVGIGLIVGGLFLAAWRYGGTVAAAVVAGLLFLMATFSAMVEPSDALTAGLICAAVAARGRWRIAFLVLAGLLRPEPWLLAAAAGWFLAEAPIWRRALNALVSGLSAVAIWLLADLLLSGDVFATYRWIAWARTDRLGQSLPPPRKDLTDTISDLFGAVAPDLIALAIAVAGIFGLVMLATRRRRSEGLDDDPFPLVVAIVGFLTLVGLVWTGANVYVRYVVPAVSTMLALGAAVAIGRFVPWRSPPVAAAVVAVGLFAAVIWPSPLGNRERATDVIAGVESSVPALRALRRCGRIALAGNFRVREHIPILVAIAGMAPGDLGVLIDTTEHGTETEERFAAVVRIHRLSSTLPEWARRYDMGLGRVAVRDDCELPASVPGLDPV